ncbi:MAG: CDP-glycerol glycerophosphotransferase family protein [Polyangiaceae bacterium]|nr:CDP-glycerol glycerophosphotransferase family protein [Polyangiaceae bacterium]
MKTRHGRSREFLKLWTVPGRLLKRENSGERPVAAPNRRYQVLVSLNLANHYPLFEPLVHVLAEYEDIDIFYADPGKPSIAPDNLLAPYEDVPGRSVALSSVAWKSWDLLLECSFVSCITLLARVKNSAQIFHGVAHKWLVNGQNITFHYRLKDYDLVAALSQQHFNTLQASPVLKSPEVLRCVGYPKLDRLASGKVGRDEVLHSYGADPSKPTVLYAPSWNAELSLQQIGVQLLEALATSENHTLLVKLHPMSLKTGDSVRKISSEIKEMNWDPRLKDAQKKGQLIYLVDHDTCRYLAAADILVTDHGSTPFEFMLTGRPIVYFDSEAARRNASDPDSLPLLLEAVHPFSHATEAAATVQGLLTGAIDDATKREAKAQLVEERFANPGGATELLKQACLELIGHPSSSNALNSLIADT